MKFYEFNDAPYYALICAKTEEDALQHYDEVVCDINDDFFPNEITEEDVRTRLLQLEENVEDYKEALYDLTYAIKNESTTLILIDGSLV